MKKNVLNPIIINNKNFKKIVVDFLFPYPFEEKITIPKSLLRRMFLKKTNSFPEEQAFANAIIKYFVLDFSLYSFIRGDNLYFNFQVTIPDKTILQDEHYSYDETIKFILDTIYNAYSKENSFYEEELEKVKNKLKLVFSKQENEVLEYTDLRMQNLLDDEGIFKGFLYNHKDEVDNVTAEELYSLYKDIIKEKRPIVFAIGNIDDSFADLLNQYLPNYPIMDEIDTNYVIPFQNKKAKINNVLESKDFNQSILKVGYKVASYKKEDCPILSFVNFMLGSNSSKILYDFLRYQNPLCYVCNSAINLSYGILIINARIYRDKKDIALEKIQEIMKNLQNEAFVEKYLENIKERKRINLIRREDSIYSVLDDYEASFLEFVFPLNKEYEVIQKLTSKDIVDFVKRLQLDTIYYLEGTRDAE